VNVNLFYTVLKLQAYVATRNSEKDTGTYCNVCLLLCCGEIFRTARAPLACCSYKFLENQLSWNEKTELPCNVYREGFGGHSGVADFRQTIITRIIGSFFLWDCSQLPRGYKFHETRVRKKKRKCMHLCQSWWLMSEYGRDLFTVRNLYSESRIYVVTLRLLM